MADIFISYAREDEKIVQFLSNYLQAQGWSVFWDRDIPVGQTWRTYIGQALCGARCVIVVWTQNSIHSQWVIEEAEEGRQRGILLPIRIDSVDLPLGFRSIHAADLVNWKPGKSSSKFEKFTRDVEAILGPPAVKSGIVTGHSKSKEKKNHAFISSSATQSNTNNISFKKLLVLLGLIGSLMIIFSFILHPKKTECESSDPPFECKFNQQ